MSRFNDWVILETMIQNWIQLPHLFYDEETYVSQFNRVWHGLSAEKLRRSLVSLRERGLIKYYDVRGRITKPDSSDSLKSMIADKPGKRVFVGLTRKGGRVWESFGMPHWCKYYSLDWHNDTSEKGTLEFADTALLPNILNVVMWNQCILLEPTARVRRLSPWKATYWKQLPVGHRLSFASKKMPSHEALLVSLLPAESEWQHRAFVRRVQADDGILNEWHWRAKSVWRKPRKVAQGSPPL